MTSFFKQITEKPWETVPGQAADAGGGRSIDQPIAKVALVVILFVVTILFWLFGLVYFERMEVRDWVPLKEPDLLWINTGVLVAASLVLEWTKRQAKAGLFGETRTGLLIAGGLTIGFIVGQLMVWNQLVELGYYIATNPANDFFYLLTGLHGLHMLGGLVGWARTTDKVWFMKVTPEKAALSVELCAIYWHFLLALWLALFTMLIYT